MATFWVNSVYLVVAIFTMFSIALPMASDFVWLFYRVYLGLAMGHFVFLMMNWYGGETAMIEAVGHDTLVNFRVRPCCFCFCCPNAAHLNKKRIRIMQGAVYQMPYIQVRFFSPDGLSSTYRVTHVVVENLPLTWVLEVQSSCLGSKYIATVAA